jgi:hypothetical protein
VFLAFAALGHGMRPGPLKVPKPSSGIWPAPWLSGILVIRRSEDSIMVTPSSYFASGITARILFVPVTTSTVCDSTNEKKVGCGRNTADGKRDRNHHSSV